MSNLKFGDYDDDTAKAEQEDLDASGAKYFKFKPGRNLIRVLPPGVGKKTPFHVVYQHWIPMVKKSVTCARLSSGAVKRECPICRKVDELKKSKLKLDQEIGEEMYAKRQVFVNIIDRANEDAGVQVLRVGKGIHEQLVSFRNDDLAGANYSHPISGYDILVERVGTGKNDTKYKKVALVKSSSPLHASEDKMQEWIDTQHDLAVMAKLPSVDEMKQMLSGEEPADDSAPPSGKRNAEDDAIDIDPEDS